MAVVATLDTEQPLEAKPRFMFTQLSDQIRKELLKIHMLGNTQENKQLLRRTHMLGNTRRMPTDEARAAVC